MAKTEKFLIKIKSENIQGPLPEKNTDFKPTDYQKLITELKEAITNNNQKQVENLLKQKFIDEANKNDKNEAKTFEEVKQDSLMKFVYFGTNSTYIKPQNGIKETYVYTEHNVSSFLEKLVRDHRSDFNEIYQMANDSCKETLMDFTGLDMSNVDFKKIDLHYANLTRANLVGAKNFTQTKLDRCFKTDEAILPGNLKPLWTNSQKESVIKHINELKTYGEFLQKSTDFKAKSKGKQAINLASLLNRQIIMKVDRYNSHFQKDFLAILDGFKNSFNERRFHSLKMIVANIALCVLGCGVGYVAAGAVHYMKTGSFAFFNRPTSYDKYLQIAEAAEPKGMNK